MRKLNILLALVMLQSGTAFAQLSANPWATANTKEDINKVYEARARRGKANATEQYYQPEESTVVDRTHAYIQDADLPEEEKDTSFMGKVKGLVSSEPKKETPLIANTADNRRKLALQKQQQQEQVSETKQESGFLPSFGTGALKKNFKLPSINATGMIKKFEKASGINLKSIGKSFK